VTIRVTPTTVEVVDDGRGGVVRAPGSGLAGLAERAAAAGGQLVAGPVPGGGYRLALTVPVDALPAPTRPELPAGAASPGPTPTRAGDDAATDRAVAASPGSTADRTGDAPATAPAVAGGPAEGTGAAEPERPATPGWTAAPAPSAGSRAGGRGRGTP
jgi:hypothetical protein